MAPAIRGVNNKNFFLYNYSLTTQIIIINLLTSIIGLVFLLLLNYFLLSNSKNIDVQIGNIKKDLLQITDYLSDNSIIRIPQYNERICENELNNDKILNNKRKETTECGDIILSTPQLDPTSTQKYIIDNFLNRSNIIKVYDSSWVKFVDSEDVYFASDVLEVDIEKPSIRLGFFDQFKKNYLKYFNYFYQYFVMTKIKSKITKYAGDIFLVKETIKKKTNLSYIYEDDSKNVFLIYSNPIIKDSNIYGVVLVRGILSKENNDIALISFNLINLFVIIIFIMFLISILFSQSIVVPIKILSKIVRTERDKSKKNINEFVYPQRLDEIGILSNDIKNMSEDLKIRINEIEGFAADVSHELKNPLASLKSSNELLIDNKITNEKKSLILKNMHKDIQRMNTLITDISNYTLTQVEIDEELFVRFNVGDFLKEFLQSYTSNSKKIKILSKFEDRPSWIYANKDKLAQVFINLIENSLSFSPKYSEVLIDQKIIDKRVVIIFSDQGTGISQNLANKIFERFYTDRAFDQNKHSGLGLSIAKKIIESFSGSLQLVEVENQENLGACFEIILPLKD